jgi:hypothetical protein
LFSIMNESDSAYAEAVMDRFRMTADDNDFFIGSFEGKRLKGFLCGCMKPEPEIHFVFTDGRFRRKKTATSLIRHFCLMAREENKSEVKAVCLMQNDGAGYMGDILRSIGFDSYQETSAMYRISMSEASVWAVRFAALSKDNANLMHWNDVPKGILNDLINRTDDAIPAYVSYTPSFGERVEDMSFCYLRDRVIAASCIVSHASDILYIDSLFCRPGSENAVILILAAFAKACLTHADEYRQLAVVCINSESDKLFRHLADGFDYSEEINWQMTCDLNKIQEENTDA